MSKPTTAGGLDSMTSNNFRSFLELAANTITTFDNTIVTNINKNTLTVTNVSETALVNLPLIAPSSEYNAKLYIVKVSVNLNTNVAPIVIPTYSQFLQEVNAKAIAQNSTTSAPSSVITPFTSQNLFGTGVGVNQLADTLSSYALFVQNTYGNVKTYTLTLTASNLIK